MTDNYIPLHDPGRTDTSAIFARARQMLDEQNRRIAVGPVARCRREADVRADLGGAEGDL